MSIWAEITGSSSPTGIVSQVNEGYANPSLEYNGELIRLTVWGADNSNYSQATKAFTPAAGLHHIVGVVEYTTGGGGNWFTRVYIDGVVGTDGSTIQNSTTTPKTGPLYTVFGAINDTGTTIYRYIDGRLDECGIWNGIVFPTGGYSEANLVAALNNSGDGAFPL
jgi:hypothetical protein